MIITPLVGLAYAFAAKSVIDLIQTLYSGKETNYKEVLVWVGIAAIVRILGNSIRNAVDCASQIHSLKLNSLVSSKSLEIGCDVDYSVFDDVDQYGRFFLAGTDSQSLARVFWNVVDCMSPMLTVVIVFCSICAYSFVFAFAMLLVSLPSAYVRYKYIKRTRDLDVLSIKNERQKEYYRFLATQKKCAQDIRLFGMKDFLLTKFERAQSEEVFRRTSLTKKETVKRSVVEIMPEAVIAIFSTVLIYDIVANKMTLGDFSLFTGLLAQMYQSIATLIMCCSGVYESRIKIKNYHDFIREVDEGNENKKYEKVQESRSLEKINKIEFKDVFFSYPNTSERVLNGISFVLSRGEKLALVGANGSGKTTILKLLLGLYKPQAGEVLINDHPVKDYSMKEVFKNIGVCLQDPNLYSFTLGENVKLGNIEHGEERKVLESLQSTGAATVIKKAFKAGRTPMTRLFEKDGVELSGGEVQKVAISRALFKNVGLLVFDEPSAALDPEAENVFFSFLNSLPKDEAVLFTTHRMKNVDLADRILVIEKGRIIESGRAEDLIKQSGRFANLYNCYRNGVITG